MVRSHCDICSTSAQLLAALLICLMKIDIIFLKKDKDDHLTNKENGVKTTDDDWRDWLPGLAALLMSGFLQDSIGRRTTLRIAMCLLILASVLSTFFTPPIIGGYMSFFRMLLSFSCSFVDVPISCFIGEMSHPNLRGVLSCFPTLANNFGKVIWNSSHAKYTGLVLLLIGCAAFFKVPESPAWLLSRGKEHRARISYQWFRGWVTPEDVRKEYQAQLAYIRSTHSMRTENRKAFKEVFFGPENLLALTVLSLFVAVAEFSSVMSTDSYYKRHPDSELNKIHDPKIIAYVELIGSLCMGLFISVLGKRGMTFISLTLNVFSCLVLFVYYKTNEQLSYQFFTIFKAFATYCGFLGVDTIPWIMIAELFPLRVRGVSAALSLGVKTIAHEIAKEIYGDFLMEKSKSTTFVLLALVGALGLIYLYYNLPETEGFTQKSIQRNLTERSRHSHQRSRRPESMLVRFRASREIPKDTLQTTSSINATATNNV